MDCNSSMKARRLAVSRSEPEPSSFRSTNPIRLARTTWPLMNTMSWNFEMTATTLGSGTAVASAEMVFDGDDVGLDHVSEDIDALTLVVRGIGTNQGPVLGQSGAAANFVENGAPVIIDSTITVVDADSTGLRVGSVARRYHNWRRRE